MARAAEAALGNQTSPLAQGMAPRTHPTWPAHALVRSDKGHAMQSLLTIEQLSIYLHKSVTSIRSDAHRNPSSLPPICRLPHTKRLLWRIEDVERWLASHVIGVATTETSAPIPAPKRGRPTKAEQIARQRQATQSATTGRPSPSHRLRG